MTLAEIKILKYFTLALAGFLVIFDIILIMDHVNWLMTHHLI
jgi:hypothetical protein